MPLYVRAVTILSIKRAHWLTPINGTVAICSFCAVLDVDFVMFGVYQLLFPRFKCFILHAVQEGQTALHVACLKDKVQLGVIKALCSAKRLDACDKNGNTALHMLAKRGKLKTIKVLLEEGINHMAKPSHQSQANVIFVIASCRRV